MSEWQPIETAPKDGTPVLVWRTPEKGRNHRRMGIDRWKEGLWWHSRKEMQPTHWMPVPAPPAE